MIEIARQISSFISNSIRLPDTLFSISSSTGYCHLEGFRCCSRTSSCARTSSRQQSTFVTLEHTSTVTCRWRRLHHKLFCSSAADTLYSAFLHPAASAVPHHLAGSVATRLWQQYDHRHQQATSGLDRLHSVLNAAARLIYNGRKYDLISPLPLLHDPHWLRVLERSKFRLTVLIFKCRNKTAHAHLPRDLQWASDDDLRRHLRSSSSDKLTVRRSQLTTADDHAFSVAARPMWNDLPADVTSAPSLPVFNKRLKTHLLN